MMDEDDDENWWRGRGVRLSCGEAECAHALRELKAFLRARPRLLQRVMKEIRGLEEFYGERPSQDLGEACDRVQARIEARERLLPGKDKNLSERDSAAEWLARRIRAAVWFDLSAPTEKAEAICAAVDALDVQRKTFESSNFYKEAERQRDERERRRLAWLYGEPCLLGKVGCKRTSERK